MTQEHPTVPDTARVTPAPPKLLSPAPSSRPPPYVRDYIPSRLFTALLAGITVTLFLAITVLGLMLGGIFDLGPMAGWWRGGTCCTSQTPGTGSGYPPSGA